jgi:hypothetical protein
MIDMGGKTLDQFNSRQQAKNKSQKETKNASPNSPDQEKDSLKVRDTRPTHA